MDIPQLSEVCRAAQALQRNIVVLDLETIGLLRPSEPVGIVEVAALVVRPDGKSAVHSSLVNPGVPIPKEAARVHKISDRMVQGAPSLALLEPWLNHVLDGAVLSGFNVWAYDWPYLQKDAKRLGLELAQPWAIWDAREMWTQIDPRGMALNGKGKLAEVARAMGSPVHDAHRARSDVLTTAGILEAMLREHGLAKLKSVLRSPQDAPEQAGRARASPVKDQPRVGAPQSGANQSGGSRPVRAWLFPASYARELAELAQAAQQAAQARASAASAQPRAASRGANANAEAVAAGGTAQTSQARGKVEAKSFGAAGRKPESARAVLLGEIRSWLRSGRVLDSRAQQQIAERLGVPLSSVSFAVSDMLRVGEIDPQHVWDDKAQALIERGLEAALRDVGGDASKLRPLKEALERRLGTSVDYVQLRAALIVRGWSLRPVDDGVMPRAA